MRKQHPAAEWGERPRETVTVMPIYSAKSDTQGAAPGPLPVPGPKLLCERFTRLLFGGRVFFLLPGTMVPHAFHGKHDSHFKPPGRGRTADLSRPAFQKNLCAICRSFHVPSPRAVLQRVRPGGRETGGVRYRVLRIATGAVRPRNDKKCVIASAFT